jgi:hypothetical protein
MAYYPDFERCTYFDLRDDTNLVAIGWLERGHDFPRGPVDKPFFDRLEALCQRPWPRFVFLGGHECDLCQYGGPYLGYDIFIPYRDRIFAAPAGVIHYVGDHWYRPPDEFIEAVLACPDTESAEYGAALLANGGPELAQDFKPNWDEEFVAQLPPPEMCGIGQCACIKLGCQLRGF